MPGLRMIAVAGPRIDPRVVPVPAGVEVRGYVPDLYRELAACDIAVVQGGLTTTMELVAARRPFLYFPLAHHFEQRVHVTHRLAQYRAGRRMDYAAADPEIIADAIATELEPSSTTGRWRPTAPRRAAGPARRAALSAAVLALGARRAGCHRRSVMIEQRWWPHRRWILRNAHGITASHAMLRRCRASRWSGRGAGVAEGVSRVDRGAGRAGPPRASCGVRGTLRLFPDAYVVRQEKPPDLRSAVLRGAPVLGPSRDPLRPLRQAIGSVRAVRARVHRPS